MEMGFPFPWDSRENPMGMALGTQMCQNGNGKSTRDNGDVNGYFFMCAKIPISRITQCECN